MGLPPSRPPRRGPQLRRPPPLGARQKLNLASLHGCAFSPTEADEATAHVAQEWDSQDGNPTHATHSYLTEYAIDQLKAAHPEVQTYRSSLVDGANRELHELPVSNPEQEALRIEVEGTNWAANHPERLWTRARASYAAKLWAGRRARRLRATARHSALHPSATADRAPRRPD